MPAPVAQGARMVECTVPAARRWVRPPLMSPLSSVHPENQGCRASPFERRAGRHAVSYAPSGDVGTLSIPATPPLTLKARDMPRFSPRERYDAAHVA